MKIGLIGRTNVGKSTLFNKLIGHHRAIVTDISGTTREILIEPLKFDNQKVAYLFDSPGLEIFDQEKIYIKKILEESDLLLFVIDGKEGISGKEEEIRELVFKMGMKKKTLLVVNKLDGKINGPKIDNILNEYYEMGFEDVIGVSALNNENLGSLKKLMLEKIKALGLTFSEYKENTGIPLLIVGRPNVGKSTLINKLSCENVSKVEDTHGTTLDYIISDINYNGKEFRLYDTAGIRKKGKIHGLERIAYEKVLSLIEFVKPVTVIVIDITEGVVHRDLSIIGDIIKLNIPLLVAINKIDTITKEEYKKQTDFIHNHFKFAKRLPIIPISGKEGMGLPSLLNFVEKIWNEYNQKIFTGELNNILNKQWILSPPRFPKNKICKFYYATQIKTSPPTFKVFINKKDNVNFSFTKWIENAIRKNFGFVGVPINIEYNQRKERKQ